MSALKAGQPNLYSLIDCSLELYREKSEGFGEDAYLCRIRPEAAIAAVFDGCGGSGAQRYSGYMGKKGAYMASRAICGAAGQWFDSGCMSGDFSTQSLKQTIVQSLQLCKRHGGPKSKLKSTSSLEFPSTLTVINCRMDQGKLLADIIWAGDSRCYMLCSSGLYLLTEDDAADPKAVYRMNADFAISNCANATVDFSLHNKTVSINQPCLLFAASDGCFGYYLTPMEFEYALLDSLLSSGSVAEWEQDLWHRIDAITGDDCSLCGFAMGYGSFAAMAGAMRERAQYLYTNYIEGLENKSHEEKEQLWDVYKNDHLRYL